MSFDLTQFRLQVEDLKAAFEYDRLKDELKTLDLELNDPGFWNDPDRAKLVQKKRSAHLELTEAIEQIQASISDIQEFSDLLDQEFDEGLSEELNLKVQEVKETLGNLEFRRMLSGEFDASFAIMSINSGAGGTEAQDWVEMLLRMYLRWCEQKDFKTKIIDILPGEEAGLKNVTLTVEGDYAYGYLKAEQGIHRLVRISPFDSNARRHTSFASISVLPELNDDIEVKIEDEDLRIDTYRSSGAGGQHVNKTDSAVRLTHLPTGLVVACQNERSQHKNKAQAMKVLKARLYDLELKQQSEKRDEIAGEKKDINFGSQIRSYTLQPYQLIKDHRTGHEDSRVQSVLDGNIGEFIRTYLLHSGKK